MAFDVVLIPENEIRFTIDDFKEIVCETGLSYGFLTSDWVLIDFNHDEIEDYTLVIYDSKKINRGFTIYTAQNIEYILLSQPIPATEHDVSCLFDFVEKLCQKYPFRLLVDDCPVSLDHFLSSKNEIFFSHRSVLVDLIQKRQENVCIIGAKKPFMICDFYDEMEQILNSDMQIRAPNQTYKIVFDEEENCSLMEKYAELLHKTQS